MRPVFARLIAAAAACAAIIVVTAVPAAAHESRPVGPLQFTVGWGDEPTFTGYKNSVTLRLTRGGQPVANVTGIKVQVKTGDQTVDLALQQKSGQPGLYEAPLIPTRTGTYTFTFTGTVDGQAFTQAFTSGEDTFDAPKEASEVAFPAKDPSPGQLAQRIDRDARRLEAAQAAAADAEDKASTATTIGIAGVVVGLMGLVALLPVLAVTGVVVGHTVTYALVHESTHVYWQAAVAVALLAGALAAGSHLVHAVRRLAPLTLPRAGVRLAALQMVIFTMMEASERIAVDQPLTSLFDRRVLLTGLVVQALVATALVQILRVLGRAAIAVADAIGARWSPATAPLVSLAPTAPLPARDAVVGRPCGSRAPPLAA